MASDWNGGVKVTLVNSVLKRKNKTYSNIAVQNYVLFCFYKTVWSHIYIEKKSYC